MSRNRHQPWCLMDAGSDACTCDLNLDVVLDALRRLKGPAQQGNLPVSEYVKRVYPDGWSILGRWGDGYALQERSGLRVIVTTAEYEGRDWMHVSLSRAKRLPSYDDMKYVKEVVIGGERWAAQLFPPVSSHVNIHQFCLHLWVPLNGSLPWPNFGEGGTI